jgi:hypothetical protein
LDKRYAVVSANFRTFLPAVNTAGGSLPRVCYAGFFIAGNWITPASARFFDVLDIYAVFR